MKYLVCSDIHGSLSVVEKLVENFEKFNCDMIILLGDIVYHGPRNPIPESYNPKKVVEKLNIFADKIMACRGNCDSEVDQMLLNFPIMSDMNLIYDNGIKIIASHGHIYSPEKLPPMKKGNIFLCGHTHIHEIYENKDGIIICNPGSPTLPKNNSKSGFVFLECFDNGEYKISFEEI